MYLRHSVKTNQQCYIKEQHTRERKMLGRGGGGGGGGDVGGGKKKGKKKFFFFKIFFFFSKKCGLLV